LNHAQKYPAFAICGYSGSGKTTLILELIRLLSGRGLRVGVVKHDAHGLNVDREGKDSDRFFRAGADVTLQASDELFLRARPRTGVGLKEILDLVCPFYDIVLLEGNKSTPWLDKVWLKKDDGEACPDEVSHVLRVLGRGDDRPAAVKAILDEWLPKVWLEPPLYAGILIGGKSSRMGQPKQLLNLGGGTCVEHLVATVRPFVQETVLLGRGPVPESLASTVRLPDVPDQQGPLAGMRAAVRWQPEASWLFLACDLPLVHARAIEWLLAHRAPGVWAVLPRQTPGGRVEPLFAYYDVRARRLLESCQQPRAVAEHEKTLTPVLPPTLAAAWTNVNTPADLNALNAPRA